MLSALEHLESRSIAHFDIDPENILLDARDRAFLADFGFARQLGNRPFRGRIGTPACAAPETLAGQLPLTTIADIWSMGITFFTLVALEFPYARLRNGRTRDTILAIQAAQPNEPKPAYNHHRFALPEGYLALINRMLSRDRATRPSAKEVVVLFDSIRIVNPLEQQQKIARLDAELATTRTARDELTTQFDDFRRTQSDATRALEQKTKQAGKQLSELQHSLSVQLSARGACTNIITRQKLAARRNLTIQQAKTVRQKYVLQQNRAACEKHRLALDFEFNFMRAERDVALKRAKTDDDEADRQLAELEDRREAESVAATKKCAELEARIAADERDAVDESKMVKFMLDAAAEGAAQLRSKLQAAQRAAHAAIEERDAAMAREGVAGERSEMELLKRQLKSSEDRRRAVEQRLHRAQNILEEVCSSLSYAY
jgi:hypothetical protein